MSEQTFRFQQFSVRHDRCAMKVGTDGVLLGAWFCSSGCKRILDIGTGTGLIALMAAQRASEAQVVGVEIEASAVSQARENVSLSPFSQRVEIVQADIRLYSAAEPFDTILCNPPFFTEDTLPPSVSRSLARHAAHLGFSQLATSVCRLLAVEGTFSVILPFSCRADFVALCQTEGLSLHRECRVRTVLRKPPRRVMLTFSRAASNMGPAEELVLQHPDGSRTAAYSHLTRDFYL